jgi:hypothetical protein
MANEEVRGELQDTRLIGSSAPSAGMGLGGRAGALPGLGGLTPVPPPYVGGPQKVFDTLPINGKRFSYDYRNHLASAIIWTPEAALTLTANYLLLGTNIAAAFDTIYSTVATYQTIGATGYQMFGSFTTLVTGFSFQGFINGAPLSPSFAHPESIHHHVQLAVSGAILSEYIFNAGDTQGIRPVFIPMAATDKLYLLVTHDLSDPNFGAFGGSGSAISLDIQVVIEGILIPDNGMPKELQVSL